MTTNEWIDRLAPKAWGVVAAGTCATYGGIHAMAGNPTGAMGLPDYLGWDWRSKAGLPVVCVPGCPVQPDNLSETLPRAAKHHAGDRRQGAGVARHASAGPGNYTWVMSPRRFDGKNFLALDTGGGPLARLWTTALAGLVDIGYVKSTGRSVQINLPKTALKPPVTLEWKIPRWSNAIERDRARSYFQTYAAACAVYFVERALDEVRSGHTQTSEPFTVPEEGIGCGFTEAVRGVLSHHLVSRGT